MSSQQYIGVRIHTDNLDLDIDLNELLAQRVDLDQTRINSAVELSKFGDKAYVALIDLLIRVRADYAAGLTGVSVKNSNTR